MMLSGKLLIVTATLLNLGLAWAAHMGTAAAKEPEGVLRARGLQIVDEQGRVRASITLEPPTVVDGRQYPETVLLRLTDPQSGPVVKLTAAADGSALGLSSDSNGGGVRAFAKRSDSFVEVKGTDGQVRIIKP